MNAVKIVCQVLVVMAGGVLACLPVVIIWVGLLQALWNNDSGGWILVVGGIILAGVVASSVLALIYDYEWRSHG